MRPLDGSWVGQSDIGYRSYTCGYCDERTGVRIGFRHEQKLGHIYLCGGCNRPTFFYDSFQAPAPILGNPVLHLPPDIDTLYNEARKCTQVSSFTASVLAFRKILMHVAVDKGAQQGQNFLQYVEHLANNGYVPPDGRGWVDHIRQRGNEANHEIVIMSQEQTLQLLSFVEMLLKFVYEFPARITPTSSQP